jgi:ribosome-binding protein aMBF1 (putative translation factor)
LTCILCPFPIASSSVAVGNLILPILDWVQRNLDQRARDAILSAAATNRSKPLNAAQIQKRFGDKVRAARLEKGISQESLAFVSDLDRAYIGGVERGERNISLFNI